MLLILLGIVIAYKYDEMVESADSYGLFAQTINTFS